MLETKKVTKTIGFKGSFESDVFLLKQLIHFTFDKPYYIGHGNRFLKHVDWIGKKKSGASPKKHAKNRCH